MTTTGFSALEFLIQTTQSHGHHWERMGNFELKRKRSKKKQAPKDKEKGTHPYTPHVSALAFIGVLSSPILSMFSNDATERLF